MNKRLKVISIISLSVFGSLTIGLTTHWLVRGQSRQNTPSYLPQPYARVNEKAGAVKGADERAIRELADAVLQLTIGDRVPSVFVSPYKERLIRAELDYRRGQREGIPEANTVRVIDELVRELSAPEYAKTDEDQVHDTRLVISSLMPHFIVQQPLGSGEKSSNGVPYIVDPTMSPLEAVYVTRFLIMQKEINESSLITPTERAELKATIKKLTDSGFQLTWRERNAVMAALIGQKLHPETPQLTVEELATRARQETAEQPKNQTTGFLSAGPSSSRYKEMQEVFHRAYTMKVSDAVLLTNRSFELLGIED
jgi:hypothetical protein